MVHTAPVESDQPDISPRVRELIRQGAQIVSDPRVEWAEALHDATLSGVRMKAIAEDPVLSDGVRRANLANTLRWAQHNVKSPGEPVPAQLTGEILAATRELVRRGLDESALDTFRSAQGVAWRLWMRVCFGLTDDVAELHELLDASSRSINAFIEDSVAVMSEQMRAERAELSRDTHAQRREAVTLVLEGAPIPTSRAETQLRYRLSGPQMAVVLWGVSPDAAAQLEVAASAVAAAAGTDHRLTVVTGATSSWMWLPVNDIQLPDLSATPDIRVSAGRPGSGVDGFRSSHFQAVSTQRMHSRIDIRRQFVRYDEIRLVSLLTTDETESRDFTADVLGDLATADPELRHTLHTWITLQCNTSHTAEALYTHRNTVIRRLARAEELLPRPLRENLLDVAAALEVAHWSPGVPIE